MNTASATARTIPSAFRQLLRKELRLQRGNLVFGLAATILGFAGLWLIRSNPQSLGGFPPADIQNGLMLAALIPVLIIILPVMIGSTAAAAEKPLGVLPWQAALPIPRWKIILAKTIIIAAACTVVAGILPYLLRPLLIDSDTIPSLFRGFWLGLHGIVFGAIGFFAGSYAKDDYQGLLLAIIPAAVVIAALILPDYFGKVMPIFLPFYITRPWAIVVRLLVVAALLVLLASRMHIKIPTRRWRPMLGSLAVVFVGGVILTLWNLQVEGSVLAAPKPYDASAAKRLAAVYPNHKIVPAKPIAQIYRGKIGYDFNTISLASGKTIAVGSAEIANGPGQIPDNTTMLLIRSDGTVHEFPQAFYGSMFIAGVSSNQEWVLMDTPGNSTILSGPFSLNIPLHLLPDSLANWIFEAAQIDYATNTYAGISLPRNEVHKASHDIVLDVIQHRGMIWKNGKEQIPQRSRANFYGQPGHADKNVLAQVHTDETTMTAVLMPTSQRGFYELSGFANGWTMTASHDGQWIRGGSKHGTVYRRVASWDKAAAKPPLPSAPGAYQMYSSSKLPGGHHYSNVPVFHHFPLVKSPTGPCTVEAYSIVEKISVDPTVPGATIHYSDFGAEIAQLDSDKTTGISLRLRNEAPPSTNRMAVYPQAIYPQVYETATYKFHTTWNQASQILAFESGNIVRFVDFSNLANTTPEELRASMVLTPARRPGSFLGPRKYLQWSPKTVYLSNW